jgi:hypothetical protein
MRNFRSMIYDILASTLNKNIQGVFEMRAEILITSSGFM